MMLSRPIASGTMLVLLIGAVGGAVWQGGSAPEAVVAEISEPVAEVAEVIEQPDAAPRVVESAGFPVVSQAERDLASEGPIVTVDGHPLGGAAATDAEPVPETVDEAVIEQTSPDFEDIESTETQVAVAEPPLPKPRPEGLSVQSAGAELDYDAIAQAAYGAREPELMTQQERQTLAPMSSVSNFDPRGTQNPGRDDLVGVVGPNGEVIWVYEEQVPTMNSRVTIQRQQPVNPFGFTFE